MSGLNERLLPSLAGKLLPQVTDTGIVRNEEAFPFPQAFIKSHCFFSITTAANFFSPFHLRVVCKFTDVYFSSLHKTPA